MDVRRFWGRSGYTTGEGQLDLGLNAPIQLWDEPSPDPLEVGASAAMASSIVSA